MAAQPFDGADDAMDIDIDIDMGEEFEAPAEPELEEGEEYEEVPFSSTQANTSVPAIYSEDPDEEIQPSKVHIRGIDELSTDDVRTYAAEHYSTPPSYVQWVDDTSANLIYPSTEVALEALQALSAASITQEELAAKPLQLRDAQPRLGSQLQVRRAIAKDKKKKNAKDVSRYYLLHPEADPLERMRNEFASGRDRRNGEHGDYNRRRYNDREDRRRRDQDTNGESNDFHASMYDDTPAPSTARDRGRGRRDRNRSASPGRRRSTTNSDEILIDNTDSDSNQNSFRRNRNRKNYRDRSLPPQYTVEDPHPVPKGNQHKELFPAPAPTTTSTLASDAMRSQTQRPDTEAAKAKLKRELFPNRTDRSNHRRSDAFDARTAHEIASNELSHRMSGRLALADTEGRLSKPTPKELFPSTSSSHTSSLTNKLKPNASTELFTSNTEPEGFSIRGSAGLSIKGGAGLSIKGAAAAAAAAPTVRELFPAKFDKETGNEGKELFSDRIKGRAEVKRKQAADSFW